MTIQSMVASCLVFGMALAIIPTSIISFVIHERETNVKHMQLTAGVSLSAYWVATFIVDLTLTTLTISTIILVSLPFKI